MALHQMLKYVASYTLQRLTRLSRN